jgi:hypothetical protein
MTRRITLAQVVATMVFAAIAFPTGNAFVRSTGSAEPKAGVNETQTDIDYWFNK